MSNKDEYSILNFLHIRDPQDYGWLMLKNSFILKLEELVKLKKNSSVKKSIIDLIKRDQKGILVLIDIHISTTDNEIHKILRALAREETLLDQILHSIENDSQYIRAQGIYLASILGLKKIYPKYLIYLDNESFQVKYEVLRSVGMLQVIEAEPKVRELCFSILHSEYDDLSKEWLLPEIIAEYYLSIGSQELGKQPLCAILQHYDWGAVAAAATACGELEIKEALPILESLLPLWKGEVDVEPALLEAIRKLNK